MNVNGYSYSVTTMVELNVSNDLVQNFSTYTGYICKKGKCHVVFKTLVHDDGSSRIGSTIFSQQAARRRSAQLRCSIRVV